LIRHVIWISINRTAVCTAQTMFHGKLGVSVAQPVLELIDRHFLVSRFAEDGDKPAGMQEGLAGLFNAYAAHLQADTQLQVGCHQGATVVFDHGLEIPQHRFNVE